MDLIFKIPDSLVPRVLDALSSAGFRMNEKSELSEEDQRINFLKERTKRMWTSLVANHESKKAEKQARESVDLSAIR